MSMLTATPEYETKHLVKFLKEEFERIIVQCGRGAGDSLLSDSQALAIWFLHQEVGMTYEAANPCVLDDKNDCGVDFIWEDKESKRVLVDKLNMTHQAGQRKQPTRKRRSKHFAYSKTI
jgi:hypothetical protein